MAELRRRGLPRPEGLVEPPRGFLRRLVAAPGVAIIAEAKKASPSKGVIAPDFDPACVARHYRAGGATALSVLTDVDFPGFASYLQEARAACALPVIRKDFIVDPYQVVEARAIGADCILLIAACLDDEQLHALNGQAHDLGMDVLIEVHDGAELSRALRTGNRLIGINNRNLNDFTLSLETTFRLRQLVPATIPVVSESGITTAADMRRLKAAGVTAALIGESLMRSGEHGTLLEELLAA